MQITQNTQGKISKSEAGLLGWEQSKIAHKKAYFDRTSKYILNPKLCKYCNGIIPYNKRRNECCSKQCSGSFSNKKRGHKNKITKPCLQCSKPTKRWNFCSVDCNQKYKYDKIITSWLSGDRSGVRGITKQICNWLRKYLFEKYNSKCCKCSWCEINPTTGKIPLEVNHIDGNADNCKENNLELICPNCHSLTPNFRSLNKRSARVR